jgi:endonuclease YncB( thermonuclease family)
MATATRVLARVLVPAALLFVFVGPPGVSGAAQVARPGGNGPVELEGYVRAVQGDTLDAQESSRRVPIGVIGIEAPQSNTPCGREATAFVQGLIDDGAMVEEEPGLAPDVRYRRMYRVSTLDGRSVAEEMVAGGFARANGQGANRDRLAELEAEARGARRGCLWRRGGTP